MVNTIAIVGHSGLLGKPVTAALSNSDASLRVLHRKGSNTDSIDSRVERYEIDYDDEESIFKALQGVDIVISLLGGPSVGDVQVKLFEPAKKAGVKLFVPSEFGNAWTEEEEAKVTSFTEKKIGREALAKTGVPFVHIATGGFSELLDLVPLYGIDRKNNTIQVYGDEKNTFTLSSLAYISAAFVQLFTSSDFASLAGRKIGIVELEPSLASVIEALTEKHGQAPAITRFSLEELKERQQKHLDNGETSPLVQIKDVLQIGIAGGTATVGTDVYDVKGYTKKTIKDLVNAED